MLGLISINTKLGQIQVEFNRQGHPAHDTVFDGTLQPRNTEGL